MNHRIAGPAFALAVGLLMAFLSYRWITDPEPRDERLREEAAAAAARSHIQRLVVAADIEIVDPLQPDRHVGKTYVYRAGAGWEVSGYYRRDESDRWHPYLVTVNGALEMTRLKVQDPALADAQSDLVEVVP